jgi:hypothetical protein
MVDGVLPRTSDLSVGLGVGRVFIGSGSRTRPSHSCDGWVCDLGVVGVPLIFGLSRRAGVFPGGFRRVTFVLVSGFQLPQHNRGNHFFNVSFSSQLEVMVGDVLVRVSVLHVVSDEIRVSFTPSPLPFTLSTSPSQPSV